MYHGDYQCSPRLECFILIESETRSLVPVRQGYQQVTPFRKSDPAFDQTGAVLACNDSSCKTNGLLISFLLWGSMRRVFKKALHPSTPKP